MSSGTPLSTEGCRRRRCRTSRTGLPPASLLGSGGRGVSGKRSSERLPEALLQKRVAHVIRGAVDPVRDADTRRGYVARAGGRPMSRSIGYWRWALACACAHLAAVGVGGHQRQRLPAGGACHAQLGQRAAVEGDQMIGRRQGAGDVQSKPALRAHMRDALETGPSTDAARTGTRRSSERQSRRRSGTSLAETHALGRPRRCSASRISLRWRPSPPASSGAGQVTVTAAGGRRPPGRARPARARRHPGARRAPASRERALSQGRHSPIG